MPTSPAASSRTRLGKDEEGKFLRVPGTNPFFPRDMADMGNRMLELLNSHEVQAFVLNTGRRR